jgi:hypothetical protein
VSEQVRGAGVGVGVAQALELTYQHLILLICRRLEVLREGGCSCVGIMFRGKKREREAERQREAQASHQCVCVCVRNTMHECINAYSRVGRAATVTCFALCQAPPGCTGREALRKM